ncbi:hypothetical protein DM01DRAFT_346807 [Hesseltinella vesiculosa]|uniref:Uncharacterized protein n=1 Tax=Hesseltinella vesiculosa TaxID=101127 RepID=A0A1X2G261_9FUNG|nr:hypothetical protein DM01DRAFT_346807 [Hesseltinella vesiculosa]
MNTEDARLMLDEKTLRSLEKRIYMWLHSLPTSTVEEASVTYSSLISQIANYQKVCMVKQPLLQQASKFDEQGYGSTVESTATKVAQSQNDIQNLREDLIQAQKVRDNKLEYDKVALEVMKLKTREEYQASIAQLEADIEWLTMEKSTKVQVLELRKSKLATLIGSVKQLQKEMDDQRVQDRETHKRLMDMGYESSDDEEEDRMQVTQEDENEPTASNRFQERNDEDDEEGLVANDDSKNS